MINLDELRYNENGLIPAIVQDYKDGTVLMMAYMSEESLKLSLESGKATYYSRSRKELWLKGETSGHIQYLKEIKYDCDSDTLLLIVEQEGNIACHTGKRSCFHNSLKKFKDYSREEDILKKLYELLMDRKKNPVSGSYTTYLFEKGIDKILKKVGEESAEFIIGAKNGDRTEVVGEASDLIYHVLLTLADMDIDIEEIYEELREREGKRHEKEYKTEK